MSNLRRLTTIFSATAQAAGQIYTEARQVASGVSVATSQQMGHTVGETLVAAGNVTHPTLVLAANKVINTAPTVVAAAQQLASRTAAVLQSPAGQRAASILAQVALATVTRTVVRAAFGPIAGNVAAGVVGFVAAVREVQVAAKERAAE
jgi:hypothetical protein